MFRLAIAVVLIVSAASSADVLVVAPGVVVQSRSVTSQPIVSQSVMSQSASPATSQSATTGTNPATTMGTNGAGYWRRANIPVMGASGEWQNEAVIMWEPPAARDTVTIRTLRPVPVWGWRRTPVRALFGGPSWEPAVVWGWSL